MNISGILVVTAPEHTGNTVETLQGLPGIDVHHVDAATGRIVITQEAETISAEVDGLRRIRALPLIVLAEISYHNFEEDRELIDGIPAELEDEDLDTASVPDYLSN